MRHAHRLCRVFSSAAAEAPPAGGGNVHQHVAGRLALGRPSPTTLSVNGVYHVRHTAVEATEAGAMSAPRDGMWTFSRPLDKLGQPAKRGTDASARLNEHTMVVGGACSAVLSGKNLHRVLQPGFQLESRVMAALAEGKPAPPLSIHTSAGTPPALGGFVAALKDHLPWPGLGTDNPDNLRQRRDLGPLRSAALGEELGMPDNDWFISLQVEGKYLRRDPRGPPQLDFHGRAEMRDILCSQVLPPSGLRSTS